MSFSMQPGRIIGSGGLVPNVVNRPVDAANTFKKGRILRRQADGEVEGHPGGATVVDIYGVSLEGATLGVSDSPAIEAAVARADRNTEFVSQVMDAGPVLKTDLSAIVVGQRYGFITVSNQDYVDFADTTNVVLEITGKDDKINIVWFKFLESALQGP